jgi:type II secretory pathway predicted ATPase ExeA/phage tail protein X
MFWSHYGFKESPFGVTPDPRYLYATATHREALASLLYGINSGLGFMTLTAMPGMGKTTLLFEVLGTIRHQAVTAFLFQPVFTPVELLRALLTELGISHPEGGLIELQMLLNEQLLKQFNSGKRVVVAIDEAQSMNDAVLEQVRMLSNFETSRDKLMQIILAGQPQLAARLASPELIQLRQRISIAARLEPLSAQETATYIRHRLTLAGYDQNASLFSPAAVAMITLQSEGIPRNINNLCFNALALACALKQTTIGPEVVREVIADLDLKPLADGKKKNDDISTPLPVETRTIDDTCAPLLAEKKKDYDEREPSLRYLFEDEADKSDWQEFLILRALPLVCVLALVFGFAYVRFLRPYRGSFHFEIPFMTAPQSQTSAKAAASEPSETRAASETSDPPDAAETSQPAPPETSESAPPDLPETTEKATPTRSVRVRRGQTLNDICAETYKRGSCGSEFFRAFLEANPGLSNPNRLVPGQKVFLPPSPPSSGSRARH